MPSGGSDCGLRREDHRSAPQEGESNLDLARLGAVPFAITDTHTLLAGQLDWDHGDPFDRLLAAIATMENLPFVSADRIFSQVPGLRLIW
ncbi:MAG: PIN domain-containing protein [Bifidobacteriaceae bacterium]|nr:PIN domain-containing protein [Bifidobacteriaceae bacterium]